MSGYKRPLWLLAHRARMRLLDERGWRESGATPELRQRIVRATRITRRAIIDNLFYSTSPGMGGLARLMDDAD